MNDYQNQAIENEEEHLNFKSFEENLKHEKSNSDSLFINQSLSQILSNISATIIVVITELLDPKVHKTPSNIMTILFKDDRMIYLGIVILIISLAVYVIDSTS